MSPRWALLSLGLLLALSATVQARRTASNAPRLLGSVEGGGHAVAFSADGRRLVAGGTGGFALYAVSRGGKLKPSGKHVRTFDMGGHPFFGPGGRELFFAPYIYDLKHHALRKPPLRSTIPKFSPRDGSYGIEAAAFSPPAGQELVVYSRFRPPRCCRRRGERRAPSKRRPDEILLLDGRTRRRIALLGEAQLGVRAIAINARFYAVGDSPVRLWSRRDRKPVATLKHRYGARDLRFSPDGKLLAVLTHGTPNLYLWRTKDFSRLLRFSPHAEARSLAWHPQRPLLATAGNKTIKLWSLKVPAVPRLRWTIKTVGEVQGLAFDRKGQRLAASVRGPRSELLFLYALADSK